MSDDDKGLGNSKSNVSLLRTPGQTFRWYLRARGPIVGIALVAVILAAGYALGPGAHKAPAARDTVPTTTTTVVATTTTTKPPPTTTTTKPHHHVAPPTTTTTRPPTTTTTTRPPTTTTTHPVAAATTTTRPPTTTTTIRRRPPTTTTTTAPQTSYTVTFTCSGGQSVTVSGTGPTASNSLTVDGSTDYSSSGQTATVTFVATKGTYVATDNDIQGGAFVNYSASPSCTS